MGDAMRLQSRSYQHFITKQTVGIAGVGKWMHRWRQWPTPECPRCGLQETTEHVLSCKGTRTDEVWDQSIQDLQQWPVQAKTDPVLMHALIYNLSNWCSGQQDRPTFSWKIKNAIYQQEDIGWQNLLEGRLCLEWEEHATGLFKIHWIPKISKKLGGSSD